MNAADVAAGSVASVHCTRNLRRTRSAVRASVQH
jgi:hypothetical protein